MACGCSKRRAQANAAKASAPAAPATASPRRTPVRRVSESQLTAAPARDGGRYRRRMYAVYSVTSGEVYATLPTLAEAQKVLRDQGPGWAVRSESQ